MNFSFVFTVTGPGKKVVEVYSGLLPVQSETELRNFAADFRGLLLNFGPGRLKPPKPPKGMVRVKKTNSEEGE